MNEFQRNRNRVRAINRDPVYGFAEHDQPNAPAHLLRQNIEQPRGFPVPANITLVSQLILPIDLGRKWLFIQNFDALGVVWAMFGLGAALNTGMKFAAGGGGVLLDVNCPTSALYMIGTIASNQNLTIITG